MAHMKQDQEGEFPLRVLMQSRHAGGIIGKGGETIKRLRSEYSAQVNVPDSESSERVLTIGASQDNQLKVLAECLPLCHEPPYTCQRQQAESPAEFEVNILLQTTQVGGVIGRGGCKIKEIRENSEAQIKLFTECLPYSSERVCAIAGTQDQIVACLTEVLNIVAAEPLKGHTQLYDPANGGGGQYGGDQGYNQGYSQGGRGGGRGGGMGGRGGGGFRGASRGGGQRGGRGGGFGGGAGGGGGGGYQGGFGGGNMQGGGSFNNAQGGDGFSNNAAAGNGAADPANFMDSQTTQVTIPKDYAGAIIGRGGERIRSLRQQSQADIKIEEAKEGSSDRLITLSGNSQQIQHAQYLMQQCVREHGAQQAQKSGAGGGGGAV